MIIHVYPNAKTLAQAAATLMAAQITGKPGSVLGLATGSSPVATYQELIRLFQEKAVDFSQATTFNLDEYVSLPISHPCSYHAFMQVQLFDHVNFKASNLPDGNAKDLNRECRRYDAAIQRAGGIDLQLLGIGRNGHIGFNEPADSFSAGTQIVNLTDSTIQANKRFFPSEREVPRQAISMGIGTIMSARKIMLLATGEDKAEAVRGMVKGNVTPRLPASILHFHHRVTLLLDEGAASKI
ncbi:MAG: glucosamine-6-phosphate deaminase [Eubacteriales bacterium]|nr:glucosamine-6-phosphate deaminase [Eubacteriales bacterium]